MAVGFAVFLIFAVAALTSSKRPLRTILNILLSLAIGLGIGAALGYVFGNMEAGGTAAAALMIALGLATAIREVIVNRKQKKTPPSEEN